MDETTVNLKKQIKILRIALIILFLSNFVVAAIKLSSSPKKAEDTEKIAVLREQRASLQTSVEIKKCIEGIRGATDIDSYSQEVFGCITAGNKLFDITE